MVDSPWKTPGVWGTMTLLRNGVWTPVPGVVRVETAGRERKIAINQSAQVAGAYYVAQGIAPASITVDIVMWTTEQYDDYMRTVLPIVDPAFSRNTGLGQFALEVINAELNCIGITRMLVLQPGTVKMDGPGGKGAVQWKCAEYVPAKPVEPYKVAEPKTSTGGTVGGVAVAAVPKGAT